MNQKGLLKVILIVILVIFAGIAGYWGYARKSATSPATPPQRIEIGESPQQNESDESGQWEKYRNEEYGFEFQYPSNWILRSAEPKGPLGARKNLNLELWSPNTRRNMGTSGGIDAFADLFVGVISNAESLSFPVLYKANIPSELKFILETLEVTYLPNGIKAYDLQEPGAGACCEAIYIPHSKLFIEFSSLCFYRNCPDDRIEKGVLESLRFFEP